MFHTLFDYKDQKVANNHQNPKNKSRGFNQNNQKSSKNKNMSFSDNFYGKENVSNNLYNTNSAYTNRRERKTDINEQFEKTKHKIKLIVFKNGFILNNGPFRDKWVHQNKEFLDEVERGLIPNELLKKGINDLGILLINRKNEIFNNLHSSYSFNNSFSNFSFFKNPYQYSNENINNNIFPAGISRIKRSMNIQPPDNTIIELNNKDKKTAKQNYIEPKLNHNDNDKKYIAFSGQGKIIKNVNIEGLYVNKDLKNVVDIYQPICKIYIRLYNGEVANCDFNYYQTLRDIYYHIRRISGSNNFYLLDGFPPRPLRDYDRTIYELGLNNSMLTQKIN